MKRIIMMLTVAALLVAALTVSAVSAFAAPITCPEGQTVTKGDNGTFYCATKSGSGSPNTERHQGTGAKL